MCPSEFPVAQRQELALSSGRSLAYYIFDDDNHNDEAILYLNGFPGSGMEASFCVPHAKTKKIVGIDRPGLGYTDPQNDDNNEDNPFHTCVSDIWELARHLKWKAFSVVGVSGGGPHALALLASYLTDPGNKPKLEKVALVGGVCVSAGTQDMMPVNQKLFDLVQTYKSSRWSRFQLQASFAVPHYLLPILPTFMVHGMVKGNKDLPEVDSAIFQDYPSAVELMTGVIQSAVRQGSGGVVADAQRCFTPQHGYEKILQDNYGCSTETLPGVHIYQGKLDVNVPLSHATYMHEEIFLKQSQLHLYDDLGHISLIVQQAKT